MEFILRLMLNPRNVITGVYIVGVMFLGIVSLVVIGYSKSITINEQKNTITLNEKEIHNLKLANALEKANVGTLQSALDRQNTAISDLNHTNNINKLALELWRKKANNQKFSNDINSILNNKTSDCVTIMDTLKLLNGSTPNQFIKRGE